MIKYTPQLLSKLEEVFEENGYKVRYERGNFKSGFCIIEDRKLVMVNKFAPIESRINTLLEIVKMLGTNGVLHGEMYSQVSKYVGRQKVEETTG